MRGDHVEEGDEEAGQKPRQPHQPHQPHQAHQAVLDALCELAGRVGIEIRIEPFELKMTGKGGLCRINEQRVILVDARMPILEQVGVIGQALGKVVPKGVPIPVALVPYLETGHGKVSRLFRPRPLARGR
jgi:hypothetical protein